MHILGKFFVALGASKDQRSSILEANKLGFRTLVFDINNSSICKKIAYRFFNISTINYDNIIKVLKPYKKKIAGVIVQGSDIPFVVSKIEKFLNIKFRTSLKAAKICSNKFYMKKFFLKKKIPTSKIFLKKDLKKKNYFPLILKPVDMSGSKGVFLCKNYKDFQLLYKKSKDISKSKKILIEKYLEGPQLSTESLIINSKVYTHGFGLRNYDDTRDFYPNILENGGIQKAIKYEKFRKKIDIYIKKIIKELKIYNGVIKSDIVIRKNRIFFIEIASRLSGGDFSETLIPKTTGVNFVRCAIKNAAGLELDTNELQDDKKIKKLYANRYFFSNKDIEIKKIAIPKKIKNATWVHKLEFTKNKKIHKTQSHSDRFGVFIVSGKNLSELASRIKKVYKEIKITYK